MRLIEIGIGNVELVQLLETSQMSTAFEKLPYACLSHCWGETRSKSLTNADTLEASRQRISVADLRQTLQDAIDITRASVL